MSPKDLAYSEFETVRTRAAIPSRVFHIGPGKAVALLMMLSDILALMCAFAIGTMFADLLRVLLTGESSGLAELFGPRSNLLPILVGLMIGVFGFGGLYHRNGWETDELRRLIAGVALVALFDAALAFVTKDHFFRLWFVTAWPLAMILVVSFRMILRSIPLVERMMTTHMVLIGNGIRHDDFAYQMRESRSGKVCIHPGLPLGSLQTQSLNEFEAWMNTVAAMAGVRPDKLQTVLVPSAEEQASAQLLTERLATMQRPFLVAVSYDGLARRGLALQKVVGADMILAGIDGKPLPQFDLILKRVLDITFTVLGGVLILPILLGISIALMLEGGPVFFRQLRVGRDRARFHCLKFRSMCPDAEQRLIKLLEEDPIARAEWETHQKLTHDPRITPVGHFLRATSLDELPQIINVLRGEMSLVGPRPVVAPEVPGYDSDHAYFASPEFRYYARCTPGITGLWQVSGRHKTSHEERVRLDRWYARNWSIWLDIVILFKTFKAVLGRSGG